MLTITEAAQKTIASLIADRNEDGLAVRLKIVGRRSSYFEYEFGLMYDNDKELDDLLLEMDSFRIYLVYLWGQK